MSLKTYREKRNFSTSPEPQGDANGSAANNPATASIFVVQKHRATQLHYDFRLQHNGTLLSWAVPKGPSQDPSVKRLAMQVEDHPIEYAQFEGTIPKGEYGGGTVMVWDIGTWTAEQPDVDAALKKGDLKFTLHGKKLRGSWVLVRTRGFGSSSKPSWLLIKHRDKYASDVDITSAKPKSALSGKLLAEIAKSHGGDVEEAATGDPAPASGKTKKKLVVKKAAAKAASSR